MRLDPHDTLIVYSDGVTEARAINQGQDQEFGEELLSDSVLRHSAKPLNELPRAMLADVEAFAGAEPQDDRTLVALRGRA